MINRNSNFNSINETPDQYGKSKDYVSNGNQNSPIKNNSNIQIKTMKNFNYNTNLIEIQTSTTNYNQTMNENKTLRIDYDKPEKSSAEILSYIMKYDIDKRRRIDPLLTQKNFRNTSSTFDFKKKDKSLKHNTNNNFKRQNKLTKEIRKEIDEISFQVPEKNQGKKKNKLSISIGTFENAFKDNNSMSEIQNDHIPLPVIFGLKKKSIFTFNKSK